MASIRERTRKDGTTSWAVLWRDADTGKQTSRTLATRADAQSLTDFLNANGQSFAFATQAASKMRSTAPPVATVVSDHIEGLTGVSAGTREKYRRIAARHITPTLGAVPVDTLTRTDVNRWVNGMTLAAKTKKNVHSLLSAALTDATARGLVDANVAKGVKLPTGEARREPVFLTAEELDLIVATIPEARHKLLVEFLAGTGLRWSEATALQVADLDLTQEHGVVAVSRAWKRAGGENGSPGRPRPPGVAAASFSPRPSPPSCANTSPTRPPPTSCSPPVKAPCTTSSSSASSGNPPCARSLASSVHAPVSTTCATPTPRA